MPNGNTGAGLLLDCDSLAWNNCESLLPHLEDSFLCKNIKKQAQKALLVWNKIILHLVFKDNKSTNTRKIN